MKDKCVICNEDTPFDHGTPVELRGDCYVEGAGPICLKCAQSVREPRCGFCGGLTRYVDIDYLVGWDHLACVLGQTGEA